MAAWVWVVGCSGTEGTVRDDVLLPEAFVPGGATSGGTAGGGGAEVTPGLATGGPSALVPTVLRVNVDRPGTWRVEYGEGLFDQVSPTVTGDSLDVRGLQPDTSYVWRVAGTDEAGVERVSPGQVYLTPPVPPMLPTLAAPVPGDPGFKYLLANVFMYQPINRSAVVVIDTTTNQYVWWILGDTRLKVVTPDLVDSDEGPVITWIQTDDKMYEDLARLVRVPISGRTRGETRLPFGHHDYFEHEDGTLAYLASTFDTRIVDFQPTDYVTDQLRIGRVGMELGTETEVLWDQSVDWPERFGFSCWHVEATLPLYMGQPNIHEWTHANSLMYIEEDDAYLVNDKYTDWFFEIDRQSGGINWIMNGRGGDFTNPDGSPVWRSAHDSDLWSHAHLSDAWSGGALLFDNGDHHDPPVSRVMEVAWDVRTKTVETVWDYPHPTGGFFNALGDAKVLPDDRILVTWSGLHRVEVVDRDRNSDWRIETRGLGFIGRLVPFDDLYEFAPVRGVH